MNAHAVRVFLVSFMLSSLALSGAWIFVDGLAHLDEFLAASGPDRPVIALAVRHFGDVVRLHGGTLLGSVALASLAFGGFASSRSAERRSEIPG
jgi:hypothetical protein